jgi:hypothetical protein
VNNFTGDFVLLSCNVELGLSKNITYTSKLGQEFRALAKCRLRYSRRTKENFYTIYTVLIKLCFYLVCFFHCHRQTGS